jgi:hypothetical protein
MASNGKSLKALEARLNKEPDLLAKFLKDPVKLIQGEGIELSPDQASAIKSQFADLQLKNLPKPPAKPKISISIVIRIRF